MSIFKNLVKESPVVLRVKVSKPVHELIVKVAEKYGVEPAVIAERIIENAKAVLNSEFKESKPKKEINRHGKTE